MSSRDRILGRLRLREPAAKQSFGQGATADTPVEERLQTFTERMMAVKGEVICGLRADLPGLLGEWLEAAAVRRLACGLDERLDALLPSLPATIETLRFDQTLEVLSRSLFESVDAGLSHCDAAIADTGSLVFESSPGQPRTLSLVPALHVALLPLSRLYPDLDALLGDWTADGSPLPANRVLVSGPSKSADIEQVLAYGVHGPKRLLTLVCRDA